MAKVRVYELAKELGVESKVVLARLGDIGEFVRSASSTLEAPIVQRLKAEIGTPTQVAGTDRDLAETAQALGIDLQAFRNQKRNSAQRTKSRRADTVILRDQIDEKAVTARWARRWIDQKQMREWREAGLGVYDDAIAAKCITEGITPDQLRTRIDGQTVANRLRGGESVSSIVIRLRARNDT